MDSDEGTLRGLIQDLMLVIHQPFFIMTKLNYLDVPIPMPGLC